MGVFSPANRREKQQAANSPHQMEMAEIHLAAWLGRHRFFPDLSAEKPNFHRIEPILFQIALYAPQQGVHHRKGAAQNNDPLRVPRRPGEGFGGRAAQI